MGLAACFRCDWEGRSGAATCPRCGASLHRPDAPAADTRPAWADGRAPVRVPRGPNVPRVLPGETPRGSFSDDHAALPADGGPELPVDVQPAILEVGAPEAVPAPSSGRGLRALASIVVLALVVAGLAVGWSRWWPERPSAPAAVEPAVFSPTGTIVFVGDAGRLHKERSLWLLDLETRRLRPGPLVPRIDDLQASAAGPGWLAYSRTEDGGIRSAWILRGSSFDVRPERVADGDLVAWGPEARVVAVARDRAAGDGTCARRTTLWRVDVATGARERAVPRDRCGRLLSLGATPLSTYYSRASGAKVNVFRSGPGFDRRVLSDFLLLSASPAGSLLVARTDRPEDFRIGPVGAREAILDMRTTVVGAEVFWRARGGPVPIHDRGMQLSVERVLAWSADGLRAVVLAELDDRFGILLVDASPGPGVRELTDLGRATGGTDAVFGADGTIYLVTGGALYAVVDEERVPLIRHRGAPRLVGPLAWMP